MSKLGIICLFLLVFVLGSVFVKAQPKSVEVPMKFRDGMPAVEVMVNGQGPFLFAIDTGGQGQARADTTLVEKLGLKKVGEAQAGDSSGQNNRTLDIVGIDSIKIGELEFRNVEAPTRNYNGRSAVKIDGILGFNLFKDYLLTLDYPNKKVRIESGSLPEANGKDIINFENPRGIPVIDVSIGNQTVKAHIDSGNSVGGFILPTEIVEKSSLTSEPRVVGTAQTVTNTFEIKEVKLKDSIRFGGFEFTEPTITYPAPSNTNIGARVLRDFVLTFDQTNKRVKLAKTMWKEESVAQKTVNVNLKDYVGNYTDRIISEDSGNLYIQRPNGMKLKMVELTKDEFTLEQVSAARLKFTRDEGGKVVEINVLNPAGVWEKAKKN